MNKTQKVRAKIVHEMPPAGTSLMHKTRPKGGTSEKIYAKVVEIGPKNKLGVLYSGTVYMNMSAAARAASGYVVDGWIYWKQLQKTR